MNYLTKTAAATMLGLGLGPSALPSHGAISVAPGDLLASFYSVDATNALGPQTYVYNLGPASAYREGTASVGTIDNLANDLALTFGPNWATSGDVRWGIVGVIGISDPVTLGDPARTSYYSQSFTGGDAGSSASFTLSSANRTGLANTLKDYSTAMNGLAENGATDGGARVPVSTINDYSDFLPPTTTTHFNISPSPGTPLNPGTAGLDLYRFLHTLTGADASAAYAPADAVVGSGQYVGSFTLNGAGNLAFAPAPEPSAGILAGLCGLLLLRRRRG